MLFDIKNILQNSGPLNVLDCAIIVVLFVSVFRLIYKTRAWDLVKGLFILMALFFVANILHLHLTTELLEKSFYFFVVAIAVMFTPELRRALERLGNFAWFKSGSNLTKDEIEKVLDAVRDTVANLSRRKVGALLVFEQKTTLEEIIASGIKLDAYISSGLLINIFEKNTPLHDGAVVIRENKVVAATCYLPLTEQSLSKDLGTRHRAAIGASEESDALVVVVSEETGDISLARDGKLLRYLTPNDVQAILVENLYKTKNLLTLRKQISKAYN